jgi:hypothetical protein
MNDVSQDVAGALRRFAVGGGPDQELDGNAFGVELSEIVDNQPQAWPEGRHVDIEVISAGNPLVREYCDPHHRLERSLIEQNGDDAASSRSLRLWAASAP